MFVVYTIIVTVISAMAIVASGLLLFLTIISPSSGNDNKILVLMTPILDLMYSICYLLIAPVPCYGEFTFVWLSTGPLNIWPIGMIFMTILSTLTIASLIFVGNSFLHRYICFCKPGLAYIYSTPTYLLIGVAINLLPIANWLAMIYFAMWPNEILVDSVLSEWNGQIDLYNQVYLGVESYGGVKAYKLVLLIESLLLMLALAPVSPLCARGIHHAIHSQPMSSRTEELHKQMHMFLSVQIACPALLMYLPLSIMFFLLFTGLPCPLIISYLIGIAMSLNPLFGPVMTIMYVKEHRKTLLTSLHIVRNHTTVATTVAPKTTVAPANGKSDVN